MNRQVEAAAARRVAALVDRLGDAAEGDPPPGLAIVRRADGIALAGRRLARRLAFDERLRGWGERLRGDGR